MSCESVAAGMKRPALFRAVYQQRNVHVTFVVAMSAVLLLVTAIPTSAGNPGVPWPATDALGRKLPLAADVGPSGTDRTVAMFYFLWHEKSWGKGPFDVTKIIASDPEAMTKNTSPPWGPLHFPHHWGESIFGYYLGDDEFVLRKHAQMLADAGVDVIIFDTSNKVTYRHNYTTLMQVFRQARQEGNRTPQVAFLTPFWDPASTVRELYEQLYSQHLFEELWFRWDEKPLILADPAKVDPAQRDFFTFRKPQPDYFQGPTGPDQWSWLEIYPQHVFTNSAGEKEQMSAGVAQNAVGDRVGSMSEPGARGRSFHDGRQDSEADAVLYGFNFAEQCERVLKEGPQAVFVTGWNEWIAGRFDEFNGIRTPPMFVDQFDHEHSRDIEPMKGGHGDNYYYQLISFVRRYKGVEPIPRLSPRPIGIDGKFEDWQEVTPEFTDTIGDPVRRNHAGWGDAGPYVDTSGRNDIVAAKVSYDEGNVYFYARTRTTLTGFTDPDWMLLYIDVDTSPDTGWCGYDFLVGGADTTETTTTLRRNVSGRAEWSPSAEIAYRAAGNEMELAIPRSVLGLPAPSLSLDFKWTDNIVPTADVMNFTLHGDAAPNDRFNFRAAE